jgi:hypothetical protein
MLGSSVKGCSENVFYRPVSELCGQKLYCTGFRREVANESAVRTVSVWAKVQPRYLSESALSPEATCLVIYWYLGTQAEGMIRFLGRGITGPLSVSLGRKVWKLCN